MMLCIHFFGSFPECVAAQCHADPSMGSDTASQSLSPSTDTIAGQIEVTMETRHSEREPNLVWHVVHHNYYSQSCPNTMSNILLLLQ